ncbi:hypothetical protein N7510_004782 [Penicillium lagena]|uniref:uncharacterized protein n=1 Tax=Penicillium lagena TaxID=94218 RepID=UPI0025415CF5|nr:uncharacterized protein N7510_004782 [Penicillium lagena]KAJ5620798.1 hypothetical protein N7510_004782 [Penicillium lagena]
MKHTHQENQESPSQAPAKVAKAFVSKRDARITDTDRPVRDVRCRCQAHAQDPRLIVSCLCLLGLAAEILSGQPRHQDYAARAPEGSIGAGKFSDPGRESGKKATWPGGISPGAWLLGRINRS